jgi:hypothetical protein
MDRILGLELGADDYYTRLETVEEAFTYEVVDMQLIMKEAVTAVKPFLPERVKAKI